MTAYQVMPRLSDDEYADLEQSIKADGVLVPIIVSPDGEIIDGHHRAEIADKHDIECPRVIKHGEPAELRTFAYALNLNRRHLSREQRRELIAQSLRQDPQLADTVHARRTGASDKTVTVVREGLQATSEIPKLDRTVGADGRERPAARPPVADPWAMRIASELAAADDSYAEQAAPVDGYLASLPEDKAQALADSGYVRAWTKTIGRAYAITEYDAERLGQILDEGDVQVIYRFAATVERFTDSVRRSRSGLRVINGGNA